MPASFACLPVRSLSASLVFLALLPALTPASTIVRFDTVLGNIDVRLFDTATPESVENFLNYVTDRDFDDSFIHRSVPGFVIQGGGFNWLEDSSVDSLPTDDPVVNEPGLTNLRGTLAYAKLSGDPDSATSGWFFNIDDNSGNLDSQNGGFTVFGAVVGNGMEVVDEIASQQIVNAGSPFDTLPVLDSFVSGTIFREDLVLVNKISVLSSLEGDYDFDGKVDSDDYDVWRAQYGGSLLIEDHQNASPSLLMDADGNGDGVVDNADYVIWRNSLGLPGDYNADGTVDGLDYTVWRASYGSSSSAADGNGDGIVNAADYVIWRTAMEDAAGSASFAPIPVPEPSTAVLIIAGAVVLTRRRR